MGVAAAKGEHNPFEVEIDKLKEAKHIKQDTEFTVEDLQVLVENFKKVVKTKTGKDFPTCPWEQLWGAICAVFDSWMTERAVLYRQLNQIPENGVLLLTYSLWFTVTWVTIRLPVLLSAATQQPERTSSTENT